MTTLLLLLIPWFKIGGNSLFRVDITSLTLYIFGQTLRIQELYLVLIFCLVMTLAFLLVTMVMGRVWCGWLCPQTTLTDLAEWFENRLKRWNTKRPTGGVVRKVALQSFYLLLSSLVAANLLWYFIEPRKFFHQLISGDLHFAAWVTLGLVALTVYLDLALVKRLMCSEFCPYGRFQTVLADQSTLTLTLPPNELQRCIDCNSCVRVCPMGIDIRQGYQVECINCGRCLDACRKVMAKRNQPGLISYRFGTEGKGINALLNPRTLLLSLATVALLVILAFAVWQRPEASLKVAVSHTAASRILKNGNQATFFNAWINNRSDLSQTYYLKATHSVSGKGFSLKGDTGPIDVSAGGNQRVDFVLVTPPSESGTPVSFLLVNRAGEEAANTEAHIR